MTTWHSTNKGCPRSPRRDTTGRNKAELSPWTLSGTARRERQLPSGRRRRHPGPPSARGHVLSFKQTNKEARASRYSPHGRTIPTGVLSHPPGPRSGVPSRCTTLTRHVKGEIAEITLWPNPLTRPKPRGLLSGATIRDTLIGVLRPLFKTQTPDKTAKPTKAHGLLLIQRKGKDSKKPSMRPIRIPSNPRNDLRLAGGYLSGPLGNLRLARG